MTPDDQRKSRVEPRGEKFSKKERLKKTSEFKNIYRHGDSFKSEQFVLRTLANTLNFNRIGFSISSRNIKNASRRNRVRRLFREVFRKNKQVIKKGFDMALVVRKEPVSKFSYKDAEGIFLKLVEKARLLI